jgi:hypothetical protein
VVAACGLALLIGLASTECQRLRANLDSYDQRYSDCMEYHKSYLPRIYALDFTSQAYQDMAADCERRATNGGPLW